MDDMDIDYDIDSDTGAEAAVPGSSESPQSGISADATNEALEVRRKAKITYRHLRVRIPCLFVCLRLLSTTFVCPALVLTHLSGCMQQEKNGEEEVSDPSELFDEVRAGLRKAQPTGMHFHKSLKRTW